MLHSPASYIRMEEAVTREFHGNITANFTEAGQQETATGELGAGWSGQNIPLVVTDELEAITNHLIHEVGQNAIESE